MPKKQALLVFLLGGVLFSCRGTLNASETDDRQQSVTERNAFRGQVVAAGSRHFHSRHFFDEFGRAIRTTYFLEGQAFTYRQEFSYPAGPREGSEAGSVLKASVFPDGERVESYFDVTGLSQQMVSRLADAEGNIVYRDILSKPSSFDGFGRLVASELGNGTRTEFIYDPLRRLRFVTTRSPDRILQAIGYTYDRIGRKREVQNFCSTFGSDAVCCDPTLSSCAPSEFSWSYSYNPAGHLESARTQGVAQHFEVNALGNLVKKNGQTQHYKTPRHPHAVSSVVDSQGALVGRYEYNSVGALTHMSELGENFQFHWNALDLPVLTSSGTAVTERRYLNETLYKRTDVQNGTPVVTLFLPGLRIENGKFIKNYGGFAEREQSALRFHHADHLGTPTATTNDRQEMLHQASYQPFGDIQTQEGAYTPRYQFTGKEKEPLSGLYDFGARLYNPRTGRFLSPDSIIDGLDPYAYVHNNPIEAVDPTGHSASDPDRPQAAPVVVPEGDDELMAGTYANVSVSFEITSIEFKNEALNFAAGAYNGLVGDSLGMIWSLTPMPRPPASLSPSNYLAQVSLQSEVRSGVANRMRIPVDDGILTGKNAAASLGNLTGTGVGLFFRAGTHMAKSRLDAAALIPEWQHSILEQMGLTLESKLYRGLSNSALVKKSWRGHRITFNSNSTGFLYDPHEYFPQYRLKDFNEELSGFMQDYFQFFMKQYRYDPSKHNLLLAKNVPGVFLSPSLTVAQSYGSSIEGVIVETTVGSVLRTGRVGMILDANGVTQGLYVFQRGDRPISSLSVRIVK